MTYPNFGDEEDIRHVFLDASSSIARTYFTFNRLLSLLYSLGKSSGYIVCNPNCLQLLRLANLFPYHTTDCEATILMVVGLNDDI
jgi:hypothetical protein